MFFVLLLLSAGASFAQLSNGSSESALNNGNPPDQKVTIFIPNAFTPNDDGVNDEFYIITQANFTRFEMTVFDRWGNPVFNAKQKDFRWRGVRSERKVPIGVYVYTLSARTTNGVEVKRSGTLTLVR